MCQNCTPSVIVTTAAASVGSVGRSSSVCGDDDACRDVGCVCPTGDLAFVNRHRCSRRVPRLFGDCVADRRRPIAVERGEDPAGSQQPGDLGEGADRFHPMQCLHGQDDIGARSGQAGVARPTFDVPDVGRPGARRSTVAHVGARLYSDDLCGPTGCPSGGQSGAAAEIDDDLRLTTRIARDDIGQHSRRHRPNRVVQVGEAREAVGVRVEGHVVKLARGVATAVNVRRGRASASGSTLDEIAARGMSIARSRHRRRSRP